MRWASVYDSLSRPCVAWDMGNRFVGRARDTNYGCSLFIARFLSTLGPMSTKQTTQARKGNHKSTQAGPRKDHNPCDLWNPSRNISNLPRPDLLERTERFLTKGDEDDHVISGKSVALEHNPSRGEHWIRWVNRPQSTLLVRSYTSALALATTPEVARFLIDELKLNVFSDYDTVKDISESKLISSTESLHVFDSQHRPDVDVVISLGGDGLLLHVCAEKFGHGPVPPVLAFNLGSLGFINPFEFSQIHDVLRRIVRTDIRHNATVRNRLSLSISRRTNQAYDLEHYQVLNDVILERGADPGLSNLEAYCDNVLLTRVQADGVVVGTPTGSTAYSLSANGSMVHPDVSGILMTPICPHSLSFRPVVLPDTCAVTIRPSDNARRGAALRVDGNSVGKLSKQESLLVTKSSWPVVCFARRSASEDWFASVRNCLHWNEMMVEMPYEVDSMLYDSENIDSNT